MRNTKSRTATIRGAFSMLICAAVLVAATSVSAQQANGPIILTIGGAIENTNRPPFNEQIDRFFKHTDVSFDRAYAFDYDALAELPQIRVQARIPGGNVTLTGPYLRDVLAVAGVSPSAKAVVFKGLDQFAAEISLESALSDGWVLALTENGRPLAVGDTGPVRVARQLPPGIAPDQPELDKWVWGLFYIEVK